MADLPISGLPSATAPFLDANLIALVQSSTTKKATILQLNETIAAALGYVIVGSTGQFPTINAAYAAGKYKMWVITDITETVTTTYTSSLFILVNNGITITMSSDVKLVSNDASASITWLMDGQASLSFTLTANGTCMDGTSCTAVSPAIYQLGTLNIINNSANTVAAVPMSAPSADLDSIIYTSAGGTSSYFNFVNAHIDSFEFIPDPAVDSYGLLISGHGQVGIFRLPGNCTDGTTLFTVTDTIVGGVICQNTAGFPTCYLINSTVQNAACTDNAVNFVLSASNGGQVSILNNARNIIAKPSGSFPVIFSKCFIAGTNVGIITAGTTKFSECNFGASLYISNATAYFNFSNCTISQGAEVAISPGCIFDTCDFGTPGGSTTLTIDAGATNTTVIGGRTNIAIIDNGVGTQIMPTPSTF